MNKNLSNELLGYLDLLAEELVLNYCTASFGQADSNVELGKILEKQPENFTIDKKSYRRNILIIGSGATHDAYNEIPLGMQLLGKLMKEKNDINSTVFKNKYNKEEANLKTLSGISNEGNLGFEHSMYLLSKLVYDNDALRTKIAEYFESTDAPNLCYEIIAHLFKHSFIDVIIDFNFDEQLSRAIELETGVGNFHYIINEGHCRDVNKLFYAGRLKKPFYIKPHGSISNNSSLRFTNKHYLDIPESIKKLLDLLLSGRLPQERTSDFIIPTINLISIGFSYTSIEFNELICKNEKKIRNVFDFTKNDSSKRKIGQLDLVKRFTDRTSNFKKNKSSNSTSDIPFNYYNINNSSFLQKNNNLTSPLGEIFSVLWRKVAGKFKPEYKPRSIGRHETMCYLFYDFDYHNSRDNPNNSDDKTSKLNNYSSAVYYLDKIIFEFALAINRNKGIVDIVELLSDRMGAYYKLYCKLIPRNELKSVFQIISLFNNDEYSENPQHLLVNIFKLDEKSQNREIEKFVIKLKKSYGEKFAIEFNNHFADAECNSTSKLILFKFFNHPFLSNVFKDRLRKNYDKMVHNGRALMEENYKPMNLIGELFRIFEKSSKSYYYSIKPNYEDLRNYKIESYKIDNFLHTNLALEYHFRDLFENSSWDILLIICESPQIFKFINSLSMQKKYEKILLEKKIVCIYSAESCEQYKNIFDQSNLIRFFVDDITNNGNNNVQILKEPFSQHNHHMAIFLESYSVNEKLEQAKKDGKAFIDFNNNSGFLLLGAQYMYRRGFSNSINPVLITKVPNGVHEDYQFICSDLRRMVSLFFVNTARSMILNPILADKNGYPKQIDFQFIANSSGFEPSFSDQLRIYLQYLLDLKVNN